MNIKKTMRLLVLTLLVLGFTTGVNGSQTNYSPYVDPSPEINKQKVVVLTYHHMLTEEENVLFKNNGAVIKTKDFESQMKWLYDQGYNTITMKDLEDFLLKARPLPRSKNHTSVLITFDDGYYSSYLHAYPILKKYGHKATHFVVTSNMRQEDLALEDFDPDLLQRISWNQMAAMSDVFDFESHTHESHGMHKGVADLIAMTYEAMIEDFKISQEKLQGSNYFAYPFSIYDQETLQAVEDTFKLAFTVSNGTIRYGQVHPLELPRYSIFPGYTLKTLERILGY